MGRRLTASIDRAAARRRPRPTGKVGLLGVAVMAAPIFFLVLAALASASARADSHVERHCAQDWRSGPSGTRFGDDGAFPIGVWLQDAVWAAEYRALGVNLYIGQWKGPTTAQLETLRAADMPLVGHVTADAQDPAYVDTMVGWLLHDEPDNAQPLPGRVGYDPPIPPADVMDEYCAAAAIEPHRPVLLNLGQGVAWDAWIGRGVRTGRMEDYPEYARAADFLSFDIYPVTSLIDGVSGRIDLVGRGVGRLKTWTSPDQRVWSVIGLSRITNVDRTPSPAEIRKQIWMALTHGAQGLVYFVHQFKPTFASAALLKDPAAMAAVREENARIQSLAPVLRAPNATEAAVALSGKVALMTKELGDVRYVFAASLLGAPQHVRVQTPGARAKELFSGAEFALRDGAIETALEPYGVRIWRFRRDRGE